MKRSTEKLAESFYLASVLARRKTVWDGKKTLHLSDWVVALDAARLTQIGRALVANGVRRCNAGDSPRTERQADKLEKEAQEIAARYGLTAEASGDPRGYVLRLHGAGLPRNNMGDGFGVA